MTFYTGSATSLEQIQTALIDACENHGWVWSSGVLAKGDLFVAIMISGAHLLFEGRTSADAGAMPSRVKIGQLYSGFSGAASDPTYDFTYPCTYDIHINEGPDEIYLIIQYETDRYQWVFFGKSNIQNLPGSGFYVAAIMGGDTPQGSVAGRGPIVIGTDYAGYAAVSGVYGTPAAFALSAYRPNASAWTVSVNTLVHSGLDSQHWILAATATGDIPGVRVIKELLETQPSAWSSESALIPMRAYKVRNAFRLSLVVDLVHARHIRLDNYEPGQIIYRGSERWKVYPWHRKNSVSRNGSPSSSSGVDHTGTFGFAIRYEGP